MIEERDLDAAVTAGILDAATRERLVVFARAHRQGAAGPDEEQFRLLTGFNDIFVTIAIGLLLFAVGALGSAVTPMLGAVGVAAAAWGLAEYFTWQRRMALPSIVLLLAFVSAVFDATLVLTGSMSHASLTAIADAGSASIHSTNGPPFGLVGAAAMAAVAAVLHWRRFQVPITVAAGAGALAGMATAAVAALTGSGDLILLTLFACGITVFALAMWFDTRDRARVTRRTDVAFWLHLLAAPLIVHPVFKLAGLLQPDVGAGAAVTVIAVYALLTLVALAIDRRALLVSALVYVIYAIQALVTAGNGGIAASFGVTALAIGLFLVLLSAAWRPIRARVLALLPNTLSARLPVAAV